ncbi:Biotin carboxyl carrier protein of acetyl-CoA carboxylase [Desulfurella amilsii]|uniref:Biotin carboxyl carrier protein of acetyl-CoA carboxylase n=1 Tax=Desulfurella amilsii TaxID=1562698 RepID=A0A1X4XVL9_9BACT|nr:acetyl-CoA carboxylase biotin carboxyl carrier protein [Desulfurella amilsii]OSS41558.1 Biotin carboxyl carrier protein of acetyl-CoA carboxylase [Desulfurella amilsii]
MDVKTLKDIIKIVENSQFVEFTYKDDELEITLKKKEAFPESVVAPDNFRVTEVIPQSQYQTQTITAQSSPQESTQDPNLVEIRSPMVATFYRAPGPDAKAYVEEGQKIRKGEVLCILEAMKIMNELEAEFDCTIEKILVENAQKVEFDQPLFLVRKVS